VPRVCRNRSRKGADSLRPVPLQEIIVICHGGIRSISDPSGNYPEPSLDAKDYVIIILHWPGRGLRRDPDLPVISDHHAHRN
jgi:hypothetical protein